MIEWFLAQAPVVSDQASGWLWTGLITAVGAAVSAVLTVYYTKGSKARTAEMVAREKLERADSETVTMGYERLLAEAREESAARVASLKEAHDKEIQSLKAQLKDSFAKHIKCEEDYKSVLQRMSRLEGVVEGMGLKLKAVEDRPASASGILMVSPLGKQPGGNDDIHTG